MLAVTGLGSRIAQDLLPLLPEGETVRRFTGAADAPPADRFFFCAGLLVGKRLADMTSAEVNATWQANATGPVEAIEAILASRPAARIVVMGSESAFAGSYDEAYQAAKGALHSYVTAKRLLPAQQLVCVAPSIVADAGMTTRRTDLHILATRKVQHPTRRFVTSAEVARLVHFLLYVDQGYLSGVVIRMNGGAHTC